MRKILSRIYKINVTFFIASLILLAFIIPLALDEVAYALNYKNGLHTDFKMANLAPQCRSDLKLNFHLPISSYIIFFTRSILYINLEPWVIRFYSLLTIVISIFILWKLLKNWMNLSFIIGLMSIGLYPILLIFNRGEVEIFCVVILAYYLYANNRITIFNKEIYLTEKRKVFLYIIIFIWLFSIHPKTLFLIPVMALFIYFSIHSITKQIITYSFLIAIASEHYFYWTEIYDCSNSPNFGLLLDSLFIKPTNLLQNPERYINLMIGNLSNLTENINHFTYTSNYQGWLIGFENLSFIHTIVNNYARLFVYFVIFFLFIANFGINNMKFTYREHLISVVLFCITILLIALTTSKNWYNFILFYSLFIINFLHYLVKRGSFRFSNIFKMLISTFSILNSIILIILLFPQLQKYYYNEESDFSFKLPTPISFHGKFTSNREKLKNFAKEKCQIKEKNNAKLILDEYTTFIYNDTSFPLLETYVANNYYNPDYTNRLLEFYDKLGVTGMVLYNCKEKLNTIKDERVIREIKMEGNYCCASFSNK